MSQDDHKRAFLELALIGGFALLGPLGRVIVGDLPLRALHVLHSTAYRDGGGIFVNADDVTLPAGLLGGTAGLRIRLAVPRRRFLREHRRYQSYYQQNPQNLHTSSCPERRFGD